MGFDDDFADAAIDALLEYQGRDVTWTPASDLVPIETRGIFVESDVIDGAQGDGRHNERSGTLEFPTADTALYAGVPSPNINDTVTIGDEVWAVKGLGNLHAGMGMATLVLPQRIEASRAGYRRGR